MKKTNEQGYSFEVDKNLTQYAQEDKQFNDGTQKGLPKNVVVLKITKGDDFVGYILFDTNTQQPLSNELGIEAIACKIDTLRFVQSCDENAPKWDDKLEENAPKV